MADDRESRQQELARLMLQKARQDLQAARELSRSEKTADEIIGFHVQQTIEKALKAVLTRRGIEYEFTHDLLRLYQQVEEAGLRPPANPETMEGLTAFAVQFRYIVLEEAGAFDRQAGIALAEDFINWADNVVEAPLAPADSEG